MRIIDTCYGEVQIRSAFDSDTPYGDYYEVTIGDNYDEFFCEIPYGEISDLDEESDERLAALVEKYRL